jgi:AraC-like DNA-binding protein
VITSPGSTKHEVAIIPKNLMWTRGIRADRFRARLLSAREGEGRLAHELVHSTLEEATTLSTDGELAVGEALLDLLLFPFSQKHGSQITLTSREALKNRAKKFIHANLHDPELTIAHIARALDCTKRYLHMSFADESSTISEHIWDARLEKCLIDLELAHISGQTVTEVAFGWGFNSTSHFSRLFKNRYGFSPSMVQKRAIRHK